jgi:hypothetical protein
LDFAAGRGFVVEQRMPLTRYFLYVGGVLLTLLFTLDAWFPKAPVEERAHADLPVIRIHSDRKWPERVVFDTSLPTIIPTQIARGEGSIPATATDVSVKATEREAFAQMQPPDAKQLQPSTPKEREPKLQRKGRIARRHTAPQPFLAARQPQFGWFRNSVWGG